MKVVITLPNLGTRTRTTRDNILQTAILNQIKVKYVMGSLGRGVAGVTYPGYFCYLIS